MKLGTKAQYALLLVLYLGRAGRANSNTVANELGLSVHYLEQVAQKLRKNEIIRSVRGPGGGYELIGDPSVRQVVSAMKVKPLITPEETEALMRGKPEHRALAAIVGDMSMHLGTSMNRSVTINTTEMARQEAAHLGSVGIESAVN